MQLLRSIETAAVGHLESQRQYCARDMSAASRTAVETWPGCCGMATLNS
jgi:hypothetical protein